MKWRFILHWVLSILLFVILADNLMSNLRPSLANPKMNIDPECLWSIAPGKQVSNEDATVVETVMENGLRRNYHSDKKRNCAYRVLVMGCSYTFGVGVNDEDTYVWQLNELMPEVEFVNGGVGGYGPFTSLVRLRRLLAKEKYDLVIYACMVEHEARNSIPQFRIMSEFGGTKENVYTLPRVELTDDFHFVDHYPQRHEFYGDTISPLMNFLNLYYTIFQVRNTPVPSQIEQKVILCNILERQVLLSAAYGTRYMLMGIVGDLNGLFLSPEMHYFDNQYYRKFKDEDFVAGNPRNHPGAVVHRYWAENLVQHLRKPEIYNNLLAYPKPEHRTYWDLVNADDERK